MLDHLHCSVSHTIRPRVTLGAKSRRYLTICRFLLGAQFCVTTRNLDGLRRFYSNILTAVDVTIFIRHLSLGALGLRIESRFGVNEIRSLPTTSIVIQA